MFGWSMTVTTSSPAPSTTPSGTDTVPADPPEGSSSGSVCVSPSFEGGTCAIAEQASPKQEPVSGTSTPGITFASREEDLDLLSDGLGLEVGVLLLEGLTEGAIGATSSGAIFDGVAVELKVRAAREEEADGVLLWSAGLLLDRDGVLVGELLLEGDLVLLPVGEGEDVRVRDGVVLGDANAERDGVGVVVIVAVCEADDDVEGDPVGVTVGETEGEGVAGPLGSSKEIKPKVLDPAWPLPIGQGPPRSSAKVVEGPEYATATFILVSSLVSTKARAGNAAELKLANPGAMLVTLTESKKRPLMGSIRWK